MHQGRKSGVVAMVVALLAWSSVAIPATSASDDPARSFIECVVRGGEVRRERDDISCRHITSYTMRTYLAGTTDCGEEVHFEIWEEIRYGTVTYAFSPHGAVDLPEVGEHWSEASAAPIPCFDSNP